VIAQYGLGDGRGWGYASIVCAIAFFGFALWVNDERQDQMRRLGPRPGVVGRWTHELLTGGSVLRARLTFAPSGGCSCWARCCSCNDLIRRSSGQYSGDCCFAWKAAAVARRARRRARASTGRPGEVEQVLDEPTSDGALMTAKDALRTEGPPLTPRSGVKVLFAPDGRDVTLVGSRAAFDDFVRDAVSWVDSLSDRLAEQALRHVTPDAISFQIAERDDLLIGRVGAVIEVRGPVQGIRWFLDSVRRFVHGTIGGNATHVHIEHFDGHPILAPDSLPVVVELVNADGKCRAP
jgi:hypothetical protein